MAAKKPTPTRHLIDDYHLLSYDALDSTNEEAKRLAAGGASHGAVIWAKRQTSGRGRMGREWVSPEGNLYVSILLSPGKTMEQSAQLSFVAAVAAADTLGPIVSQSGMVQVKWPNDVLIDGRKVGGILLESFEVDGKRWVTVGVGINVDHHPEKVAFPAICLRSCGVEIISPKIVLSRYIYNFIQRYDQWDSTGFERVREEWLKYAWRLGMPIVVTLAEKTIEGTFKGLDDQGHLQLELPSGAVEQVSAGDVFYSD